MSEADRGGSPMEVALQQITALTQVIQKLQKGYLQLKGCLQHPPEPPTSSDQSSPSAAPTVVIFGDRKKFRSFRISCYLYFVLEPHTFSTETLKVGYIISLLSGEPQTWAHGLLEQESPVINSVD